MTCFLSRGVVHLNSVNTHRQDRQTDMLITIPLLPSPGKGAIEVMNRIAY